MKDLGTLILETPEIKEDLIKAYRNSMEFDYSVLNDLSDQIVFRASEVMLSVKNKPFSKDKKEQIYKKFLRVVESFI